MRRRRLVGFCGLTVIGLFVLAITMTPAPIDRGRTFVWRLLALMHNVGVPDSFGYPQLEFTANLLMFLPLGFFVGLMFRRRWIGIIGLPFFSLIIEFWQWRFLPERVASLGDVLANSLGAWIGIVLASIAVAIAHPTDRESTTDRIAPDKMTRSRAGGRTRPE